MDKFRHEKQRSLFSLARSPIYRSEVLTTAEKIKTVEKAESQNEKILAFLALHPTREFSARMLHAELVGIGELQSVRRSLTNLHQGEFILYVGKRKGLKGYTEMFYKTK